MQIIVHRGTHQIGGCITEIKSEKARIIIDIGANLPGIENKREVDISKITKNCDGIFLTHYHGDHLGEYMSVPKNIPIFIGEQAQNIFLILQKKLAESPEITGISQENIDRVEKFITVKASKPIFIKDIKITPIRTDHSAFDSYMYLIETENKRILHTGDFRIHGITGKGTPKILKNIGKIDLLISEGTMLSRPNEQVISEFDVQNQAIKLIKSHKYIFIMCSSTNIDRISAFYHANKKAGKKIFICDDYQKKILDYVMESSISHTDYYDFSDVLSFTGTLWDSMVKNGFCMLVRNNDMFKKFIKHPLYKNSLFIYSQWKGYIEGKHTDEKLVEFVPKNHEYLHTSGHATADEISKICDIVKPKMIIPIHGEEPNNYFNLSISKDTIIKSLEDGEIFNF